MTTVEYKKSMLLPIGVALIAIGLLTPGPVAMIARSIQPQGVADAPVQLISGILLIGSDLLRVLFFGGVACVIIGALRNRRERVASSRKAED